MGGKLVNACHFEKRNLAVATFSANSIACSTLHQASFKYIRDVVQTTSNETFKYKPSSTSIPAIGVNNAHGADTEMY
jgi:hypothetical protein